MPQKITKIIFITERRADYSRLKPIMIAVKKSKKLKLLLVVSGMHLLKGFGQTEKIISRDGFKIDARLPIFTETASDKGESMVKALGKALIGLPSIFNELKPDLVFTGFDIGVNFAAAITAMHMNILVSHIQGGEVTGSIDEVIRHALTKFSHIHFAATDQSAERIIKLGENPKNVFVVGSPSLDTIHQLNYPLKKQICNKYHLEVDNKLIIFLQHPVTSEVNRVVSQIKESILALDKIKIKYNVEIIAIYSNNDAGGKRIIQYLKKTKIKVFPHIVYEDFLQLMKVADVLVGNSSAGIHEAPSFGLPVVNIGTRQQFRERGDNIINADYDHKGIIKALEVALFSKQFIKKAKQGKNPYDHGNTANKVVNILENLKLPSVQKVITY